MQKMARNEDEKPLKKVQSCDEKQVILTESKTNMLNVVPENVDYMDMGDSKEKRPEPNQIVSNGHKENQRQDSIDQYEVAQTDLIDSATYNGHSENSSLSNSFNSKFTLLSNEEISNDPLDLTLSNINTALNDAAGLEEIEKEQNIYGVDEKEHVPLENMNMTLSEPSEARNPETTDGQTSSETENAVNPTSPTVSFALGTWSKIWIQILIGNWSSHSLLDEIKFLMKLTLFSAHET